MSPSWRESLQVQVDAQSLRVGRLGSGVRPRLREVVSRRIDAATPQALSRALGDALADMPVRGLDARVELSGRWVRLALLTEARGLRHAAERQAAGAHALRRIHGDAAATWRIASCAAGAGTLLAAGVDVAVVDALDTTLRSAGVRPASLQPTLVTAFERCRTQLRRPSWWVSLEPGHAVVAYADGRRLRLLNSHRLAAAGTDDLSRWLTQARLLDGVGDADAPLVVAHRGLSDSELPALPPGAVPVAVAGLAGPVPTASAGPG